MDAFKAFPKSVKTDWAIFEVQRATVEGDVYTKVGQLEAIVERGSMAAFPTSPDAQIATVSTLLFVKPSTLPTTNVNALKSAYIVADGEGLYYNIVDASEGFNQETGELEHIEFSLEPTSGGVSR